MTDPEQPRPTLPQFMRRIGARARRAIVGGTLTLAAAHEGLALVLGSASVTYGVGQVYAPAGWIAGGALLAVVAGPFDRPAPRGDGE